MGSADKEMTVTEVLNFLHDVIRLQKSASLNGQVSAEECPPLPLSGFSVFCSDSRPSSDFAANLSMAL